MKEKWLSIKDNGLPHPGYYIFKDSNTGEARLARVKEFEGKRYWTVSNSPFNHATHYRECEEGCDILY